MEIFKTMARMAKTMSKNSLKRDAILLAERVDKLTKKDKNDPKIKDVKLAWRIVRKELDKR